MSDNVVGFPTPQNREPFVDAVRMAEFLGNRVSSKTITKWARDGKIPAHDLTPPGRKRHRWAFLLSEISDWVKSRAKKPSSGDDDELSDGLRDRA